MGAAPCKPHGNIIPSLTLHGVAGLIDRAGPSGAQRVVGAEAMEKGEAEEKKDKGEKAESSTAILPVQRVKNIIRVNDRVAALSNDAAFLMTKATESFIGWVTSKAFALREARDKRRVLEYNDFPPCVSEFPDQLEFCTDLLPQKKPKWQHLGMEPPANLPQETEVPPAKKRASTGTKPSPKPKAEKSGQEPKEPKPKKAAASKNAGQASAAHNAKKAPAGQHVIPGPSNIALNAMNAQMAADGTYSKEERPAALLNSHVSARGGFELNSFQGAQLPGFSLHNDATSHEDTGSMQTQANEAATSYSNGSSLLLPQIAGAANVAQTPRAPSAVGGEGAQVPPFALQGYGGMKASQLPSSREAAAQLVHWNAGSQNGQGGESQALRMPELPPLQQARVPLLAASMTFSTARESPPASCPAAGPGAAGAHDMRACDSDLTCMLRRL
eukprot:761363-Hanusia_phi.AAC.1